PTSNASVCVGPPLSASDPSSGDCPGDRSPVPTVIVQLVASWTRLWPPDVIVSALRVKQSDAPPFPATIELRIVIDATSRMPMPLIVTLLSVQGPPPSAWMPPPSAWRNTSLDGVVQWLSVIVLLRIVTVAA